MKSPPATPIIRVIIRILVYKYRLIIAVMTKTKKVPTNIPNMNLIVFLKPDLADEIEEKILFGPGVKTDIKM
jgi:hypothetical protein